MNMQRKIARKLSQWKEKSQGRYPLLIEGARSVGKTYVAEAFAREAYRSYMLIDFSAAPAQTRALFEEKLRDPDSLLISLSAIYGTKLYPRDSLIIFDEVQAFPQVRSAIRPLVSDGRFDYLEISSGAFGDGGEIDAPEEERIQMFPMDLEEVLAAMGDEPLWDAILDAYDRKTPLPDGLHRKAIERYRRFLLTGGMPEAVAAFLDGLDVEQLDEAKRRILRLYRADMEKYPPGTARRALRVFDSLPAQLRRPYRRFRPSLATEGMRTRELGRAIGRLETSMTVNICRRVAEPATLRLDGSAFKCFVGDTGLLVSMAFDDSGSIRCEIYKRLLGGKLEVDEGPLSENMVAQMLRTSGHKLLYYSSASRSSAVDRMGADFLIIRPGGASSPVIVKSGNGTSGASLDKFAAKFGDRADLSYVISRRNLALDARNRRVWLPFYMTALL